MLYRISLILFKSITILILYLNFFNISKAAEIPFDHIVHYYEGCALSTNDLEGQALLYQKMVCQCHANYMRNNLSYQELVQINMSINEKGITPKIVNYMNDICIKEIIRSIEGKNDTDNKKTFFNTINVTSSDSMQNISIDSLFSIKSNIGDLKIQDIDYINSKGKINTCSDQKLILNRTLGYHLREYLYKPIENETCFINSLMTRITLKVECPDFGILKTSKICEGDNHLIDVFYPANIKNNLNVNISNDKKNIIIVLPYANISQYYGALPNHNNYTVEKIFFKNNTDLPIKEHKETMDDTSYYLLLSYFIESVYKWNKDNNYLYNIKYVYDYELNEELLNTKNILLFPHHTEYVETRFLDAIINYNNSSRKNSIKILNFAAANLFRPIKFNKDSIILFTKNKSKIVDEHFDKMKKLCLPIYESSFCAKELSNDEDWESLNSAINYNKEIYFPICPNRNNFFNEEDIFESKTLNVNLHYNKHYPYIGEYSLSDCNNRVLLSHKINGEKFNFITVSDNENSSIFNVNTNGLGINFFTSELTVNLLENFLQN